MANRGRALVRAAGAIMARRAANDLYSYGKRGMRSLAGLNTRMNARVRARKAKRSLASKSYVKYQVKMGGYPKALDYEATNEIDITTPNNVDFVNTAMRATFGEYGPYFSSAASGREYGYVYLKGVRIFTSWANINSNANALVETYVTYTRRDSEMPEDVWFKQRRLRSNNIDTLERAYSNTGFPAGPQKIVTQKNVGRDGGYTILKHWKLKLGLNNTGGAFKENERYTNYYYKFKKPIKIKMQSDIGGPRNTQIPLTDVFPKLSVIWTANSTATNVTTNVICTNARVTWYYADV